MPIIEVGDHHGQHFFSMGYVEGESVAARLAGGRSLRDRRRNSCATWPRPCSMPDDYRQVILLRNIEELSYEQIAERMGRSVGAVRMLWVRALAALRDALPD